jgi:hypothetical protein
MSNLKLLKIISTIILAVFLLTLSGCSSPNVGGTKVQLTPLTYPEDVNPEAPEVNINRMAYGLLHDLKIQREAVKLHNQAIDKSN